MLIVVPLMSFVLKLGMLHFGALAVMLSICAMLCNMVYNHAFEWFEKRYQWQRNLWVRSGHAVGFEVFFTLITVPLTAWWLNLSLLDAFLLDLVLTAFFMLYAFFFNWLYDTFRGRIGN